VICSECRAENGHLPSCKFHTTNAKARVDERMGRTQPNAAAQATPQPQSPTPPPQTSTPVPQEAPAASNAEPDKVVVLVNKVERRTRTGAKGNVIEYFALACTMLDSTERMIFCFHMTAGAELEAKATGKACLLRISSKVKTTKDVSTTFYQVEEILEIAGVKYHDGKPVTAVVGEVVEEGW
jgi:hypothetical protein